MLDIRTVSGTVGTGTYTALNAAVLSGIPNAVFTYARLRCGATAASGDLVRVADPHLTAADANAQIVTGQQWSSELSWPFGAQIEALYIKGSKAGVAYELVYSVAAPA